MEKIFGSVDRFIRGKRGQRETVPMSHLKDCAPCHRLTPKLVEWYRKLKAEIVGEDQLELIYIQGTEDERFKDMEVDIHFDSMPWLALPITKDNHHNRIYKLYHVTQTPTLVFVNALNGCIISDDGFSFIDKYPNGEGFPWPDKSFVNSLVGSYIEQRWNIFPEWIELDQAIIRKYDYFCLFHTEPEAIDESPTAQLVDMFYKFKSKNPSFMQVIYIPYNLSDGNEQFTEHIQHIPKTWLIRPHKSGIRSDLMNTFHLHKCPTIVIVDVKADKIVRSNGEVMIRRDPEGKNFPWPRKLVEICDHEHSELIQETPCLMWFTDGSDEQVEKAEHVMTPVVQLYSEQEPSINLCYFINDDKSEFGTYMREAVSLPEVFPALILFNYCHQVKYVCTSSQLDEEAVHEFVRSYLECRLKAQSY